MDFIHLILIALFVLAISTLITRVFGKKKLESSTTEKLNELTKNIAKHESRLQIVRSHAIDYQNNLGAGTKNMLKIELILANLKMLADKVDELNKSKSRRKLKYAHDILEGQKSIKIDKNEKNIEYTLESNWEETIEALIQELGVKIAEVSQNSKTTGIPTYGRQYKRETIHDLEQAGINISEIRKDYS